MTAGAHPMDSVARGTVINLVTRLVGVGLVLALTTVTARIGTETLAAQRATLCKRFRRCFRFAEHLTALDGLD